MINEEVVDSLPFITGMGYRKKCDFIYDDYEKVDVTKIDQFDGMKFFIKTNFINEFINKVLPHITFNFIIYTHNSDMVIDKKYGRLLSDDRLLKWYGQNINIKHDKLSSIPIGIANYNWSNRMFQGKLYTHGDVNILKDVIDLNTSKTNMVHCNFNTYTNPTERIKCLKNIHPTPLDKNMIFKEYLKKLSSSYFTISPNGNGVDCHKHWEAMYLKTIPIVTKSINISHYNDYPFLVIDDWDNFGDLTLTKELYHKIWGNFNLNNLYL